ncbi:unnamed protein product [Eruca vesicaria subsp. sativa]|uniref:CTLH domain-containing protein n=1 Tax=Eruca vesicaria subsp. sativa TaxID=29727 RepID=A0ABC8K6P1_ERUVS|nr:unnamed protein product [Eruca vesicaria subsp. sativa]
MDGTIGSKALVKKTELVRVITDTLISLGFNNIATDLENLSGVNLLDPLIKNFLNLAKNKEWNNCIKLLEEEEGLQVRDHNTARFLLLEQNFLNFLKDDNLDEALHTLQEEMTPLGVEESRLVMLSSKLVFQDHSGDDNAEEVVRKLKKVFLPGVIVPEGRLVHLLEESLDLQRSKCGFHNVPDSDLSLCFDHHCAKSKIPSRTVQVLVGHADEVWFLKFSHNGEYLASSSRDKSAIIWETNAEGRFVIKHRLVGHEKPVVIVLWSPDDKQVITCGENEVIKRWDVVSGQCVQTYERVGVGSFSCGWLHDGSGIIGAMADKRIYLWNLDGSEVEHEQGQRAQKISDVVMTSDGKWIVSVGKEQDQISLFDRVTRAETVIQAGNMVTSFCLSSDNKYLLVNLVAEEIHLWDIVGEPGKVGEFIGHKRTRFIIRSCFGGYREKFIASGSEDSKVYIWKTESEMRPCLVLLGHGRAVNCVDWNPTDLHMLASGSDDRTIRVWGLE